MAASVWRGSISFGLVTIPVRLVKAARRERTRFRRVQRVAAPEASEPLGKILKFPRGETEVQPPPPAVEEAVVRVRNEPMGEILKGYEVAKDEFVVVTPEEVSALRPRTSTELEITEFVKTEEIDPIYYETSYYVVPDSGGEKPYSLLFAALKQTGHAGLGSLAMHGREHVVLIRAGKDALVLHTMFYANEVSPAALHVDDANPKELELANMLVRALESKFEPEKWKDHYEERLQELIGSRAPAPAASAGSPTPAPAADIMEALRKSLEAARKPVASEQRPPRTKRSAKRK